MPRLCVPLDPLKTSVFSALPNILDARKHLFAEVVYSGTFYFTFYNCIAPMGFLPWEIRVAFPGESQLRQGRASQPTVHAGCFSVSIIPDVILCG